MKQDYCKCDNAGWTIKNGITICRNCLKPIKEVMEKNYKAENAGHYGPKMTVMQPTVVNVDGPSENMASLEMLCNNENYHDCDDYNTEFCRKRCEFAPKSGDDDIILPDIEPDK